MLASMQLPSKHVAAETKTLLPNGSSFPLPGDGASPPVAETPGGFLSEHQQVTAVTNLASVPKIRPAVGQPIKRTHFRVSISLHFDGGRHCAQTFG